MHQYEDFLGVVRVCCTDTPYILNIYSSKSFLYLNGYRQIDDILIHQIEDLLTKINTVFLESVYNHLPNFIIY